MDYGGILIQSQLFKNHKSPTVPRAEKGISHKTKWMAIYYALYIHLRNNNLPDGVRCMTLTDATKARITAWLAGNQDALEAGDTSRRLVEINNLLNNNERVNLAQIELNVLFLNLQYMMNVAIG